MIKTILKLAMAFAITGLLASNASAGPVQLSNAQMDGVAAGGVVRVDGFVCPVLGGKAGLHGKSSVFVQPPGGFYTVIGPDVSVPVHATNMDGAGSPGGPFASPGEADYTAIWAN